MKEKIEEAEEKIEQKTQEVGKEFLSKWFYKKKKPRLLKKMKKKFRK